VLSFRVQHAEALDSGFNLSGPAEVVYTDEAIAVAPSSVQQNENRVDRCRNAALHHIPNRVHMDSIIVDVRTAIRRCARSPGLSSLVVVAIALAIVLNAAMFSVMNAVWFNLVPYPSPHHIVVLASGNGTSSTPVSWPDFDDWRRQNRTFTAIGAWRLAAVGVGTDGVSTRAMFLSASVLSILGCRTTSGRLLNDADERGNAPQVPSSV
jgi:MacB-like periplasmic core domain